ncbi:MAG: hypothetical protein GY750_10815 [Lentisphaerae bacterium]|nr:hypothetical protein [Lentisphaerota bacterium]MCP4101902.1 hypothetical protein [Lentisphaerota bacterium]
MHIRDFSKPLTAILLTAATIVSADFKPTFSTTEHIYAGADVKIHFTASSTPIKNPIFTMPNGLEISYGQLVAMPDFFSVVGKSASNEVKPNKAEANFILNFNALAEGSAAVKMFAKIWPLLQGEYDKVTAALEKGQDPSAVFQSISEQLNKDLNKATGGGSIFTDYYPLGTYLKLAEVCYDHFNDDALRAYAAGHSAAIKEALYAKAILNGKVSPDPADMEKFNNNIELIALDYMRKAYAMNGFASHYIMDRFAGGHLRTPLRKLHELVTPSEIGSRLANYMHNEDDCAGIIAYNMLGERWIVYGDSLYFSDCNHENRQRLSEVLQLSADDIFEAYNSGVVKDPEAVQLLLPYPAEPGDNMSGHIQPYPMFEYVSIDNKLLRRDNVEDRYDNNYISSWWGWSTWALISSKGAGKHVPPTTIAVGVPPEDNNLSPIDQAILFDQVDKRKEYIEKGIITDPGLLEYYNH